MKKIQKIKLSDGSEAILFDTDKEKILVSPKYNFKFDKKSGFFARWGKNLQDDGDLYISAPEIVDMEISTVCNGVGTPCRFCYKSNTKDGQNMTIETFQKVFSKLPPTVGQIAFGIGDIDANPDLWKIMEHCRQNTVVPNITINGARMKPEYYDNLAKYCGAVAVSVYSKELTYNAIKELTDRGMKQINIHFMISEETYEKALSVVDDIKTDSRLSKLNAIVFLSLKPRGNAVKGFTKLSQEKFNNLVKYAMDKGVNIGFDSCSSAKALKSFENHKHFKTIENSIEPCESSIYSTYIDVNGDFYPCSFSTGTPGWDEGISVLNCSDFMKDVWQNTKTLEFKEKVIECRNCKVGCNIFDV